jgi:glutamate--cysteine ligase
MDLDPFEPVGIGAATIAFLDVFLLHCLLAASPPDTPAEIAALARNQHRTAERGREPGLRLECGRDELTIAEWGSRLVDECAPIAIALDAAQGGTRHADALVAAAAALREPQRLPSARVLGAMRTAHDGSYTAFIKAASEHTKRVLTDRAFSAELRLHFNRLARESVQEQLRIAGADTLSFEEFRQQYLSPQRLVV